MPNRILDPATLHGISDAETAIQRACDELDQRIRAKGYQCEPTKVFRTANKVGTEVWRVVVNITNAKPFEAFLQQDNRGNSVHDRQSLRAAVEDAAKAVRRLPALDTDSTGTDTASSFKAVCL